MFATRSASAYAKVGAQTGVATADPHGLVLMLFEGAIVSISAARIHLERGEVALKGQTISKAIEIIANGLKVSLDIEAGGTLSERLAALYDYMCARLLHANARNDRGALDEVAGLLNELHDAWKRIAPGAEA